MNTNTPLLTQRGTASLLRPIFSPGLLLEDEDLTSAVAYTQNSLRLMMRSLFGCGRVCGLELEGKLTCKGRKAEITVKKGVALDCKGNPIEVREDVVLEYVPKCDNTMPPQFWVAICYVEESCMPTNVACSQEDDDRIVHRRSFDRFDVRLYKFLPECACSCEKPEKKVKPRAPGACCDDEAAPAAANEDDGDEGHGDVATTTGAGGEGNDHCACYADHNIGKCECDCGGHCVLLGRLDVGAEAPKLTSNYEARRFVRPMLLGAQACYCDECLEPKEEDVIDPEERKRGKQRPVVEAGQDAGGALNLRKLRLEQIARKEDLEVLIGRMARHETNLSALQAQHDKAQADLGAAVDDARLAASKALRDAVLKVEEKQELLTQARRDREALEKALRLNERRIKRQALAQQINTLQGEVSHIESQLDSQPDASSIRERHVAVAAELKLAMEELGRLA